MAVGQFQAALRANPRFPAAHILLAHTLGDLDSGHYHLPPTVFRTIGSEFSTDDARKVEARKHWKQVLQLSATEASMGDSGLGIHRAVPRCSGFAASRERE